MTPDEKSRVFETLARIEARTDAIADTLIDHKALFVPLDRFKPVERVVYGSVSAILLGILAAVGAKLGYPVKT